MATMKIEIDTEANVRYSSPRQERIATAAPKVLFVSSIDITADMVSSFSNGALNVGVSLANTPKGKFGYASGDTTAIENYLKANAHGQDLIVTAGGLITHLAAKKSSSAHMKNWIALLGSVPTDTQPSSFLGGVLLDSYNANRERYFLLRAKNIPANQIALYVNPNSTMNASEVQNWQSTTGNNNIIRASGNNNSSQYAADLTQANFSALGVTVRGLVISADPFFGQTRGDLITAANAWLAEDTANRQICYPHQVYANTIGSAQPTAGQSTLYGPAILDPYVLLGQLAAAAINQKNNSQFLGYWPVKDRLTIVGAT